MMATRRYVRAEEGFMTMCTNYDVRARAFAIAALVISGASFGGSPDGGIADPRTYLYSEDSVLAVGKNFSPNDITEPKFPCIHFTSAVPLDNGPPSTSFHLYYVRNIDEIETVENREIKADVNINKIGAAGDIKSEIKNATTEDSVVIVVSASTDFGRWQIPSSASLVQEAKDVLSDGWDFEKLCGSRYVSIERRGAVASAAIIIGHVTKDFKDTVARDITVKGGYAEIGATATMAVNNELHKASKQDRVQVQVTATGGGGLGTLAQIVSTGVKESDAISVVEKGLSDFLTHFKSDNAPAYQ
ncbi:hypothetical protein ACAX43_28145 [Paraburkholderia sp. IW21]|uniref:hypothetical protein n=1 Tax=Paraburkholderia sp. IW21 TaxID=3242488 RepID=UPI0035229BC3